MRLPASAVALFYKLYHAVLLYTNHQLGLARQVTTLAQLRAMPEEAQYELRTAFYAHRQVLEAFVQESSELAAQRRDPKKLDEEVVAVAR